VKAGHGIHGRTDKKNPWISELSGFLRTINKIDSVSSVALSKQVSYRIVVPGFDPAYETPAFLMDVRILDGKVSFL
jgi:hypothetical protein